METSDEAGSTVLAIEFMLSLRGRYIMGQALQIAIESLESVTPEVLQEKSNISDMKRIRDALFPMGAAIFSARKEAESLMGAD